MNWIKDGIKIILLSLCLFLATDFLVTWGYGARGFSKFFISNTTEGRHNKPGFSGSFGSLFQEFHGAVNIGSEGERLSVPASCGNIDKKVLFIGDSTTAGFEVDDDKTFVSLINKTCNKKRINGINLGVRAHDTHAVIGTYNRISSRVSHDYVVYLMTGNDFYENLNPNAYNMFTRNFGRRYEGNFVEPDDGFLWSIYASARMFTGDRLSLTTEAITLLEYHLRHGSSEHALGPANDIKKQATKAFELIKILASKAKANRAQLIVVPYPSLSSTDVDERRNRSAALLSNLIRDNLESVIYSNDLDSRVIAKITADGKQLSEMRFQKDGHLSEYGHKIMSQILLNIFIEFEVLAKNSKTSTFKD